MICSHNVSYLYEQPDFYFAGKTILLMMIHFRTWVQSLATDMQLSLLIHCAHSTAPFGPLIGMDLRLSLWNVTDEHQRHSNNLQGKYIFFLIYQSILSKVCFSSSSVCPLFSCYSHTFNPKSQQWYLRDILVQSEETVLSSMLSTELLTQVCHKALRGKKGTLRGKTELWEYGNNFSY